MKRITSLFVFSILIPFISFSQVGIGTTTPEYDTSLEIETESTQNGGSGLFLNMNGPTNSPRIKYGILSDFSNVTGTYGLMGLRNDFSNNLNLFMYGISNNFNASGSGGKVGTTNNFNTNTGGYHWGTRNFLNSTAAVRAYGVDNLFQGDASDQQYGMNSSFSGDAPTNYGISNSFRGDGNVNYGIRNDFYADSAIRDYGVYNYFGSDFTNTVTGVHNYFSTGTNTARGELYGFRNDFTVVNTSDDKYGYHNYMPSTMGGIHYGVYSDVRKANSFAGYFLGNVAIGTTAANTYTLPGSRGALNQVIQTDGSGNATWVDSSSVGADADWFEEGTTLTPDDINDDIYTMGNVAIGQTDAMFKLDVRESGTGNRGLQLVMIGTNNNTTYGQYIVNATDGSGDHYGTSYVLNAMGSGKNIGVHTIVSNIGSGDHYGVQNNLNGIGDGLNYGIMNTITSSGDGLHYGAFNSLYGSGSGLKYGSFNLIDPAAGGTHYGVYSEVLKATSWAGYFLGNVSIGTTVANTYTMPASRGTANQVMQSDGAGIVSWGDVVASTSNGLSLSGSDARLGGALTQITNVVHAGFNLNHNLNGTGDFVIQDNGTNHFEVRDNGNSYFGGSSSWFQTDTSGTQIASLFDIGANGVFAVNNGGVVQHFIYGGGTTLFNVQGIDTDFQVSGENNGDLFYIDASTDNVGVGTSTPIFDIHLKESSTAESGGGGIAIESNSSTNNWRIYHSGSHFSFAENGVRRAYVTAATGAYMVTSDRKLKKNISEVTQKVLPKLSEINTYTYHYKDQNPSEEKTLGVMAQEVQPHFPELVQTNEDGNLGMNYAGLSVVAIQAIKEQQVQIDTQQNEIEELKLMVNQLLQKKQ